MFKAHAMPAHHLDEKGIEENISRIVNMNPKIYNEEAIAQFLRDRIKKLGELLDDYIHVALAKRYLAIDSKLGEEKTKLTLLQLNDGNYVVEDNTQVGVRRYDFEVPAVVGCDFPSDGYAQSFSLKGGNNGYNGYGISVQTCLPKVLPDGMSEAYVKAVAEYHRLAGEAGMKEGMCEIAMKEMRGSEMPKFRLVWALSNGSVSTKSGVAAREGTCLGLIMKVREKEYVVGEWKIGKDDGYKRYFTECRVGLQIKNMIGEMHEER